MSPNHDARPRVRLGLRWEVMITTSFIISVILGLVLIIALVRPQPDHAEIGQRLDGVVRILEYHSCLFLIPPTDRVPEAVAACQASAGLES